MLSAWAELVPGTVSDVVSKPESCVADSAPTIMTATQRAMTTMRHLITARVQRSSTLEA